ncbi:unnamed protein product [Commensalibacter papalotli (ex Botero et al. 2024)]|nr:unnamed protein product [Commensalibacter papalotli (ex Botero et al. 2024)]
MTYTLIYKIAANKEQCFSLQVISSFIFDKISLAISKIDLLVSKSQEPLLFYHHSV